MTILERDSSLLNEQRHERSRENLPSENALRDEAQRDVHPLTSKIALPSSNLVVLQCLVDCEGVEEDEERNDDADHEARHFSRAR